jgi:hypothetical protein
LDVVVAGEAEMVMAPAAAAAAAGAWWPCREERDMLADDEDEDGESESESERDVGESNVLEADDDVGWLESLAGCLP